MKLNAALVERALDQLEAQALPENHPAVPQLNSMFGEHTFFLDTYGLSIVEPVEAVDAPAQAAKVIKLAEWKDATRTSLVPHDPEPTDLLVVLDADNGTDAA